MTVSERIIARVEIAISMGASALDIKTLLTEAHITGYDAWLAFKAGEVSQRMWECTPVAHPPKARHRLT